MVSETVTLWSRSIVARLMMPVAMMLVLVCLLGLVGMGTRSRLHGAYDALTQRQMVRNDLTEVRSLSRSLQRDALNFLIERDRNELKILHGKFATRSLDMRNRLDALQHTLGFVQAAQARRYMQSQRIVLDRLASVALAVRQGDYALALRTFRRQVRPNEREASRIADALIADQDASVLRLTQRAREMEREEAIISVASSVILFLIAAAATLMIVRRSIVRPLTDIEREMTRIAGGETDGRTPHADRHDELGRMARAIDVFRASIFERERLRRDQEQRRVDDMRDELRQREARRESEARDAERSRVIASAAQDLEDQVEDVLARLRVSAHTQSATSIELSGHSATAITIIGDVEAAVARAAGGAADIAATTHQFMTTLEHASVRTRRSALLSAQAAERSEAMADRMARVQSHATRIGAVVELIAGIAKQTNLLSLNATIEAARVGDAGVGFAVVAGEIKALAGRTARATDEVATQIADLQSAAHDAGDSLTSIATMIAEMAQGADLLARNIDEQAQSGHVIDRNVAGAAQDLELVGSRVAEVATAAAGVDGLATRVKADASELEISAVAIHRALSEFFGDLHIAGRAAPQEGTAAPVL